MGAGITMGSQFLPGYVKTFSVICPVTDVRVFVELSDSPEMRLLRNELDCPLIEGIAHNPGIVPEAYMEDRLIVICSVEKGLEAGPYSLPGGI